MLPPPTLESLAEKVAIFGGLGQPDRSSVALAAATAPGIDLAKRAHRAALLTWLNQWGCRIRQPRPGEPDPFDRAVARWWRTHAHHLPAADRRLAELDEGTIVAVGVAFDALANSVVARTSAGHERRLGPTAAAKSLHTLRPTAITPWDAAIAVHLHGTRDGAAFAQHQRVNAEWARAVLREAKADEATLVAQLGRPGASLARVLDQYCYVVGTLGR